ADQIEEGRLAGTVRPDHRAHLARAHLERDAVDGLEASEMAGDVGHAQERRVCVPGWGRSARHMRGRVHQTASARRKIPSTPRGNNSTMQTKIRPMKVIQFSVTLER